MSTMPRWLTACTLVLAMASPAWAAVDVMRGNYQLDMQDIRVWRPGLLDFTVVRSYSSVRESSGLFGAGWCSSLETRVRTTVDGNLLLVHCGSGREELFAPKGYGARAIARFVDRIMAAVRAEGHAPSRRLVAFRKALLADDELREMFARAYGIMDSVKPGKRLLRDGRGLSYAVLEGERYRIRMTDGKEWLFALDGRLLEVRSSVGARQIYTYDGDRLTSVGDVQGAVLHVEYDAAGRVTQVRGVNGRQAMYHYDGEGRLTKHVDHDGKQEVYRYDRRGLMTEYMSADGHAESIAYDATSQRVVAHTAGKCVQLFQYLFDRGHQLVDAMFHCAEGESPPEHARYELTYGGQFDGRQDVVSIRKTQWNRTTRSARYDLYGFAIHTYSDGVDSRAQWDQKGRLVRLDQDGFQVYRFHYLPGQAQPIRIDRTDSIGTSRSLTAFRYRHDQYGRLIHASKSGEGYKQQLAVGYDADGNIAELREGIGRTVNLVYDPQIAKASVITLEGVGQIRMTYKPDGTVKEADTSGNPEVAVAVSSMFNKLLELVDLSELADGY
ncbi:DUF6531 domain-containing protein [Thiobacillus denitrificans]|uniref:DUF6531 domain-containing protein n=1 Tax=Thiobacillus denitrificans TaxID=36861 RepID=UPI00037A0609|nr:DUF6531 domain-containing protein [Thiobacillus denitrificans]